jgi:hypothetical protein
MVFIYALKLEQEKYYIGKTNNPQFRLKNHFNLNGSVWTQLYKPLQVLTLIPNCDDYDEDKITKKYMDKYGINNVRGGSFVSVKLKKSAIDTLTQMNNGTNDKCFICGKKGHFAKECEEYEECEECEEYEEYEEVWCCEYCGKEFNSNKGCLFHESVYCKKKYKKQIEYESYCFRCGREGHYESICYASKHIKGYYLK